MSYNISVTTYISNQEKSTFDLPPSFVCDSIEEIQKEFIQNGICSSRMELLSSKALFIKAIAGEKIFDENFENGEIYKLVKFE